MRYRGYVYDWETGLYYLQSRYYNPEIGRFINADAYVSTGTGLLGYNMFAYCNNNPVNFVDPSGCFLECFLDDCDLNDGLDNGMCGGGGRGAGPYHYKGGSSTVGRSSSYSGGFSSGRYTSNNSATRTYGNGGSKTIEDIIRNLPETTNGKGVARNFESTGGFGQTIKDFFSLNPTGTKEIQTQYGSGKVGKLSNGTTIVARPGSTTGGATLKIRISNSKVYKIRY